MTRPKKSAGTTRGKARKPASDTIIDGDAVALEDTQVERPETTANTGATDATRSTSAAGPSTMAMISLVVALAALGCAGWMLVEARQQNGTTAAQTAALATLNERVEANQAAIAAARQLDSADQLARLDARLGEAITRLEARLDRIDTELAQLSAAPAGAAPEAALLDKVTGLETALEDIRAVIAEQARPEAAPAPPAPTADADKSADETDASWWSFFGDALRISRIEGDQ